MGSVSTIYNGVRTWLAGRALMDVAFSNRSTNGLQNKVITAKKDEIEGRLDAVESDLENYQTLIKTAEITGTTDANGRLIGGNTSGSGIVVVSAWGYKSSNLVVPYRYINNDAQVNVIGFKVTSSETGSVVANTTMTIKYAYLDTTLI